MNPGVDHAHDPPDGDPDAPSERISGPISDPLPRGALAENVQGRKITTPEDGFGKLWRKRFSIRLAGATVSPAELVEVWRTRYTAFWPKGSRLYQPLGRLQQGDVAAADLAMIGGTRIGTGIVVADVRDTSFTFASLQGHTFCGTITFSGSDEGATTVAQVEVIARASDPLYELFMPLGGHWYENRFWKASLVALARYFGVQTQPEMTLECLDAQRTWRNAGNIVHNAFLHTAAYLVARQVRRVTGWVRARGGSA